MKAQPGAKNVQTSQPALPYYSPPRVLSDSETAKQHFERPRKRIVSPASLQRFQSSSAFEEIMGLIMSLNEAVKGRTLSDKTIGESPTIASILDVLSCVDKLVEETPPVENAASRFGNPAFRDFYKKVRSKSREFHEKIVGLSTVVGVDSTTAIDEVALYFEEAWGNEERIDYGSGMELNFLCWM